MTSQPVSKRPAWFPFAVVGGVVATLMVGWSLLPTSSPAPTSRETFTLVGKLTVPARSGFVPDGCIGDRGFSDIQPGTQVTVRGTAGGLLATGALSSGRMESTRCAYGFTVPGVPHGEGTYVVEVSGRGAVSIGEDSAATSGAVLTLG